MNQPIDYCSKCTTICCEPCVNLKVTPAEFDRVFANHRESMEVNDLKNYFEISAPSNGACPNYRSRKCSVYEIRPIECRLYPYSIQTITERRGVVHAFVHGGTRDCPFKAALLLDETEVRVMVEDFLAQSYPGQPQKIVIEKDPNYNKLRWLHYSKRIRFGANRLVARIRAGFARTGSGAGTME